MFNYRLKDNPININSDDFLYDYLRKLGIQKTESFLEAPSEEDELDPFLLDRMDEAVALVNKHLSKNSDIFIVVDSDVDGYSSSAIMYSYLKDIKPSANIDYYIHAEKEHGVVPSEVPFGTALVIIPDAGSNQFDQLEELTQRGVDVLVLDHHLVDEKDLYKSPNVVVVNNQISPLFRNKSLSGAGVVYKFTQAYTKTYNVGTPEKYVDLAMLGILSDMMLVTELDNNYIIRKGLPRIRNKMFQALLERQSYSVTSVTNPTIIDIVFYVTPIINGTIRMGDMVDKTNLFTAFITPEDDSTYTRTWRGETLEETLYEKVARESANVRQRQNTLTEKTMERICEVIEREKLYENQVIIYKTSKSDINDVQKSLTGLVAMKILQKYNRPTLILRPVQDNGVWYYRGSGRGKKAAGFLSFKQFLSDSGLVEYAEGHDMAFGTGIKEEDIPALTAYANTTLSNVDFGTDTIEVDYIFNNQDISPNVLREFAKNIHLYGNGIPQPMFAFELVLQPDNFVLMGKNKDTVKITYGGVSFIKFKSAEWAETISYMQQFALIRTTIIGRAQLNEFNGRVSVQIVIDQMNTEELVTSSLF